VWRLGGFYSQRLGLGASERALWTAAILAVRAGRRVASIQRCRAVQGGADEEKQSGGMVRALAASAVRRSAIDGTEGTGPIRFAEQ
jgi:hypothetical protein